MVLRVNLTGQYNMFHAVFEPMRAQKEGLVINVISTAAKNPSGVAGMAYQSAKFGMMGFGVSLNKEAWKFGIRTCNIFPDETNTEIMLKRPGEVLPRGARPHPPAGGPRPGDEVRRGTAPAGVGPRPRRSTRRSPRSTRRPRQDCPRNRRRGARGRPRPLSSQSVARDAPATCNGTGSASAERFGGRDSVPTLEAWRPLGRSPSQWPPSQPSHVWTPSPFERCTRIRPLLPGFHGILIRP